mgnify:CR=1 FL=1
MYRDHIVGVVVPAYNEEGRVGDVVRELPASVDAIVLVDDASTDGTWLEMGDLMDGAVEGRRPLRTAPAAAGGVPGGTEARDRQAERRRPDGDGRVNVLESRLAEAETAGKVTRLRHRENRGAGGAIKTGYLEALARGVDVVVTIDGDGQMDASQMSTVLDPVVTGQAGYAKGNRFADVDVVREMPPFRLVGNLLLTALTRISSGYWGLSDPQNGFTAISRDALRRTDIATMWEYYGYMNQLVARLNAAGVRVADVPMPTTYSDEISDIEYPQYIRRVSTLLLVSFGRRVWTKYSHPRALPVPVGYVAGGLLVATTLLRKLRSRIASGDTSWSDAVTGVALGAVVFVAAAIGDGVAEPTVVDVDEKRELAPTPDATGRSE